MSGHNFYVRGHAYDQFADRGGVGYLDDELCKSEPFGAQAMNGFLLMLPCGLVAAGCREWIEDRYRQVVRTVLTRDFATANMESRKYHWTTQPSQRVTTRRKKGISKRDSQTKHGESGRKRHERLQVKETKARAKHGRCGWLSEQKKEGE